MRRNAARVRQVGATDMALVIESATPHPGRPPDSDELARVDTYIRTGTDVDRLVGIDWGSYGVPKTYVVGRVHTRRVGPSTEEAGTTALLPLIEKLRR